MHIGDIARLANVSISTVSKVVNGKDQGINPKTRERVLTVVKEYSYTPYSSVRNNHGQKMFLLGFLSTGSPQMLDLLAGVQQSAQKHNYGVIVCDSGGDLEREKKYLTILCRSKVDGVLWEKADKNTDEPEQELQSHDIPFYLLGYQPSGQDERLSINYFHWGYSAAKRLIDAGHHNIGCVIHLGRAEAEPFIQGFRHCLFESQIVSDEKNCIIDASDLSKEIILRGLTGFVCADGEIAASLCNLTKLAMLKIPENLSVIAISDSSQKRYTHETSLLVPPTRDFGNFICEELVARIEKTEAGNPPVFNWDLLADDERGIDVPFISRRKNILVIGSVHMDVLINMAEWPQVGKTVAAHAVTTIPGGKGLNQAVGVARLNGGVSLIARIGRDSESADLHNVIYENHINPQGLSVDENVSTGKAYIYIPSDAESSIIVYAGANNNLSTGDIAKNEALFKNTSYCLLAMEIPLQTAEFAADMAKRNHVKVIMKPSTMHEISDSLLTKVTIFVPNEQEANVLCPDFETIEQKALYFFKKGIETVIITLGSRGCYVKNAAIEGYFPAVPFPPVDTTGGADAFISALAVYLNEKFDIAEAIRRANCAAAFCISRQSVLHAMVDRTTLELYMARTLPEQNVPNSRGGTGSAARGRSCQRREKQQVQT
jgi:ribokinase